MSPAVSDADLDYWTERLSGGLGVQELVPEREPAHPHGAARTGPLRCGPVHPAECVAAVALLLRRYTGESDVVLGLPVTREDGTTNLVVLRQDLSDDVSVQRLLDRVSAELDTALAHREVPYERVVDEVAADRPLFQVALAIDGLVDLDAVIDSGQVDIRVGDGTVTVRCADELLAEYLCADLLTVFDELVTDRSTATVLRRSTMEPPAVEVGSDDLEHSLAERFVARALRSPDAVAVRADDGALTYGDLHRAAAGIAAGIAAAGAGTGTHIGVLMGHGRRTPAAIMGVLLSGNAYVPLDPSFPAERLRYMAGHARMALVLVEPRTAGVAAELTEVRAIDVTTVAVPSDVDTSAGPTTADSAAYLLYTSGSTGRPKGVRQNHRNVQFQVRNHVTSHRITARDRISVLSSFGFDASVTDLFTALLTGATAVLVDIRTHGFDHLARRLVEDGVTVYHSTPTVYRYLLGAVGERGWRPDIRVVLLGGEELTARDVRLFREFFPSECLFVNGYGATEVSFACQHTVPTDQPEAGRVLPIGRPLAGIEVLLLGQDGRPACLRGEIAVRSPYVSVGYWDNAAADAAKFLDWYGVRCYRTGDVGRRLPDGRIVFAGRRDRQVKVRGYRVELGEIEAVLADDPTVGQVAVVARTHPDGSTEITAYVAAGVGRDIDAVALRERARTRLPHFMVPSAVVVLDALPLTPTGKVDVRGLPEPVRAAPREVTAGSRMERVVAGLWCEVLGVPTVGFRDNFFDAGGHSLLMAEVARRLTRHLGRSVPLHRMFEHPTVSGLARYLTEPSNEDGQVAPGLSKVADRMARRRSARRAGER